MCVCSGGRLISLNKISLEGVTFNTAASILQSSPDEVELIVSQPKRTVWLLDPYFTIIVYVVFFHTFT